MPLRCLACPIALAACSGAASAPATAPVQIGTAADPPLVALTTGPLDLSPAFAPQITDYYVRCAAGDNRVELSLQDETGSTTRSVVVVEDQAIVVRGRYWIRCLPHDFPEITVTTHAPGAPTPGYYRVNGGAFAIALDTHGTPVWYSRWTTAVNVDSLEPDQISFLPDVGSSFGYDPSAAYQLVALDTLDTATVAAVDAATDVHELQRLPDGDYLLLAYPLVPDVDLSGLTGFGANETMADCQVQEVDATGALVWSWLASDHVDPVRESLEPAHVAIDSGTVADVFHCNSIDADASGNLLVSMRHANAVLYIDRASGHVDWKLGGAPYSKDGATLLAPLGDPEGTFAMQHDARFLPNGDISLFDDHGVGPGVARAVEYALDPAAGTASVAFQYLGLAPSLYEGGFRRYVDGHSVICWGYNPADPRVVVELDGAGDDVLDIALSTMGSYRANKVGLKMLNIDLMRAAVTPP